MAADGTDINLGCDGGLSISGRHSSVNVLSGSVWPIPRAYRGGAWDPVAGYADPAGNYNRIKQITNPTKPSIANWMR